MSGTIIGRVKSGSGKSYEVRWDAVSKEVYVSVAGWTYVGEAKSASEAMTLAEAFVYNK